MFADDPDDMEMKAEIECLQATMQVKIANSGSEYRCLNKQLDKMKKKVDDQESLFTLSYKMTSAEKGKHILMSAKSRSTKIKQQNTQIEIKEDSTDLEVTIEESDHLYGSRLIIIPVDQDDTSQASSDNDRGMGRTMGKVFGNKNALETTHITSPKH